MSNELSMINKRTKVELGLIFTILSVSGGLLAFAYKGFAMVEVHEVAISSLKTKVEKIDKIAEDVSYIRGRLDRK